MIDKKMSEAEIKYTLRCRLDSHGWWFIVAPPKLAHVLAPIFDEIYFPDHREDFERFDGPRSLVICTATKRWMSRELFAEHLRTRFFPDSEESPAAAAFLRTHDCLFVGAESEKDCHKQAEELEAWLAD